MGQKSAIMPKLYLVPNNINDDALNSLPAGIAGAIKDVRVFFVEEPKSARRLLKALDPQFPLADCRFLDVNEPTSTQDIHGYVKLLKEGDSAVISEAGCPCVADPGAELVSLAHQNLVDVVPLVGPSSILLALMASGLNGQNFAFNGYLPKDGQARVQKVRWLEERSFKEKQAQIFMETPYRNQSLLEDILSTAQDKTLLCIACDITGAHQAIRTMSIKEWKKQPSVLEKRPALFLLQKM